MGYYSDVVLVLSKKGAQALNKRIEEADMETGHTFQVDFADKYLSLENAVLYYWENIKWYTFFPEVRWLEDFIDSLDEKDFLFVRIGEEYDDTEQDGEYLDNPFCVSISRKITFNG